MIKILVGKNKNKFSGFLNQSKRYCTSKLYDKLILTEKISLAREIHEALNLKKLEQESYHIVCEDQVGKKVALAVNLILFSLFLKLKLIYKNKVDRIFYSFCRVPEGDPH